MCILAWISSFCSILGEQAHPEHAEAGAALRDLRLPLLEDGPGVDCFVLILVEQVTTEKANGNFGIFSWRILKIDGTFPSKGSSLCDEWQTDAEAWRPRTRDLHRGPKLQAGSVVLCCPVGDEFVSLKRWMPGIFWRHNWPVSRSPTSSGSSSSALLRVALSTNAAKLNKLGSNFNRSSTASIVQLGVVIQVGMREHLRRSPMWLTTPFVPLVLEMVEKAHEIAEKKFFDSCCSSCRLHTSCNPTRVPKVTEKALAKRPHPQLAPRAEDLVLPRLVQRTRVNSSGLSSRRLESRPKSPLKLSNSSSVARTLAQ